MSYRKLVMLEVDGEDILEYELEYEYYPGTPAKLDGPPENCYPADPSEVESLNPDLFTFEELIEIAHWVLGKPLSAQAWTDLVNYETEKQVAAIYKNPPGVEYEGYDDWD